MGEGEKRQEVSLLQLSPFFASIFPLFPQKRLILRLFFARSLTLVPRSLLLNRTETLATQAKSVQARAMRTMETRN